MAEKNRRLLFTEENIIPPAIIAAAKIHREKLYAFDPGSDKKNDSMLTVEYKYNENGYITSAVVYNGSQLQEKLYSYSYYTSGVIASKKTVLQKNKQRHFTEVTYSETGDDIFFYSYDDDSTNMQVMKKEYNIAGNCTHIKYLDTDGRFKPLREYEYLAGGEISNTKLFLGDNNFISARFERTDTAGLENIFLNENMVKAYRYGSDGTLVEESRPITVSGSGSAGNLRVTTGEYYAHPFFSENNTIRLGDYNSTWSRSRRNTYYAVNSPSWPSSGNSFDMITLFYDNAAQRTGSDLIETKKYSYNTNGTLAQTTVLISGKPKVIIKHYYGVE